jgi:hypothetical protein
MKLRFLADENIFPNVITHLRNLGHDVKGIHFGDILRYPPQNLPGIILLRIHPPLLDDIFKAFENLFENYHADSFKGRLIVLSKSGYRIR